MIHTILTLNDIILFHHYDIYITNEIYIIIKKMKTVSFASYMLEVSVINVRGLLLQSHIQNIATCNFVVVHYLYNITCTCLEKSPINIIINR